MISLYLIYYLGLTCVVSCHGFSYMQTSRGLVEYARQIPLMSSVSENALASYPNPDFTGQLLYMFEDGTLFCALLQQQLAADARSLDIPSLSSMTPTERVRVFWKEIGKRSEFTTEHILFASFILQWISKHNRQDTNSTAPSLPMDEFPMIFHIVLIIFQLPALPLQTTFHPRMVELIHTECEYIRDLVLLFLYRLRCSQSVTAYDLNLLFPDIASLVKFHMTWCAELELNLFSAAKVTDVYTCFQISIHQLDKLIQENDAGNEAMRVYTQWMATYSRSSQDFRALEEQQTSVSNSSSKNNAISPYNNTRQSMPLIRRPTLHRWPSYKSSKSAPNHRKNSASSGSAGPMSPLASLPNAHMIFELDPLFKSAKDVDFYLTKPVQRICKYPLFINEFRKVITSLPALFSLVIPSSALLQTWNQWLSTLNERLDGHEKAKSDLVVLRQLIQQRHKEISLEDLGAIQNRCEGWVTVIVEDKKPEQCKVYYFTRGIVFMHSTKEIIFGFIMFSAILNHSFTGNMMSEGKENEMPQRLLLRSRSPGMSTIQMIFSRSRDFMLSKEIF